MSEDSTAKRPERIDLLTPAEVAIDSAITVVARSSQRPEMAVVLLQLARGMVSDQVDGEIYGRKPEAHQRWPREIAVDHGDGTVSLLQDIAIINGSTVRARRADDVFRKDKPVCDCECPPGRVKDFAAISVDCPIHGDDAT